MRVYFDFNDWWIGYYRGKTHHYVCPVPCVVICWDRKWKNRAVVDSPLNAKLNKMLGEIYDKELTRQLRQSTDVPTSVLHHRNADGSVTFHISTKYTETL